MSALRQIAQIHDGDFRLTPNQNLIIANVPPERAHRDPLAGERSRTLAPVSGLRRNSMACVALPTCGLALAESERYLPDLMTALDERLAAHGLSDDDIVIRMTGCPNGCARPYLAEIGLVGKGPGRYNLYLGAAFDGSRMTKLYAEDLDHDGIIAALDPVFAAYARERQKGERFGDFAIRAGFVARDRQRPRLPRQCGQASRTRGPVIPVQSAGDLLLSFSTRFAALRGNESREIPSHKKSVNTSISYALARSLLPCSENKTAAGRIVLRTELGDRQIRESRYGLCEASRRRQR